jgi:tetratricopeptide (TPR) repeat protein
MAPVGLRNLKVGGEFVLATSQMGTNFYIGNNPSADGTYASLKPGRGDPQFERVDAQELAERALSRSLTATQVSNYWFRQGWEYIRARPFEWLSLFGRKWLITWNVREVEDSDDFYIYQQWSTLLKGLAIVGNFGFLAPLAAVGVLLTLKDSRRMAILYGLILAMAFSVALFYVFGRYRFPLVPMLALFAGAGVVRLCNIVTTKQLSWLLGAVATAILAWFIVHWPVVGKPGPTVAGYNNLARVFAKTGQPEEAIKNYRQALQLDSQNPVAHYNLGSLLGMQGSAEEAKLHLEQAIEFEPGYAEAHANLGNVLLMLGNSREAIERYRKALELDPNFDDTRSNLGMALLQGKDFDGAAEQFKLLLKKRPDDVRAHFLLANALAARGQLNEAIEEFREVLRLEPDHEKAHVGLARALAMAGRAEEAIEQYQRALALLKSQRDSGGPGK